MSILSWLLKPKKEMAKEYTKRVRIGKYTISSHAQNRVADPKRNLKKMDMIQNLYGKSIKSSPYIYKDGTVQYDKLNKRNKTVTNITKYDDVVKSIRKYHSGKAALEKEIRKFGGRGYEKNKKK
jgi:hypothetical protein